MANFNDTSRWEKMSNSTIIYRYDHKGETRESELEKGPHMLFVSIDQLSVQDSTSWDFADEERPETESGFRSNEYIRAIGRLNRSRIHAFIIGESATVTCERIEISIQPTTLEALQKTSKHHRWSLLNRGERPEDGWLKDELGVINIADTVDFGGQGLLLARLYTDEATFVALVQKIKSGFMLRSAQLEILADLFQLHYDHGDSGILRERNGGSISGYARARLEGVTLVWAPKLEKPHNERDLGLDLPPDMSEGHVIGHLVSRLASDVKTIRERVDILLGAAIGVVLIYGAGHVLDWFGMR